LRQSSRQNGAVHRKTKSIRERLQAVFPAIPHCCDLIGAADLPHDPDVSQVFRPKD
jgi:hypothetical protein